MQHQMSITSRILIAFASGALVAVFFLPAWRIDLFAPQYPEGLTMYIWISKLSGDVDIINGLNHYIGMKHISAAMFPEFTYMPFVVVFFMLLGMAASISGNRKLLLVYIILTVIGGILVVYDLYTWGYEYGHNLDPKAAIVVPGLSYQPPVFGHKRLLNFDAYSYPDVAGWIVAGAGILAIGVWIVEWFKHRKMVPAKNKIALLIAITMGSILSSCSTQPSPFVAGKDECFVCKMGIADLKYGGEVITRKGKLYKFDDAGCMISFLEAGIVEERDITRKLVMNYKKPNEFLPVESAVFLVSPDLKSPMNSHIAGFSSNEEATIVKEKNPGELFAWPALIALNRKQ